MYPEPSILNTVNAWSGTGVSVKWSARSTLGPPYQAAIP